MTLAGSFKAGETTVHHDPVVVNSVSKALRAVGKTVSLVPTMGALHAGHIHLVRQAKRTGAVVIVSIFVNPLQFGAGEDLDAYPRTLDADVELLRAEGVELVFAPSAADMYPSGPRTTVLPGPLGSELEGASRPTHFEGMLTVVAKLLQIAAPHAAYFGEKDYQQLTLIRQMVRDLNFDVKIFGVPTVREQDGLALSSRNRFLDADQRNAAVVLSAALVAGAHAAAGGASAILATARGVLDAVAEVKVDYLELRGVDLGPAPEYGDGRLLVAAKVGTTRLIDNVGVAVGTGFLAGMELAE
ncbi:MAG: pantoate--beta-alanine ligase [Rhodococcus sp. (in: high G+C Gram-positive bacteria)]|jgi:pantoate--beta-alanine ligase|uniref:pantoate--beta-alanine ligase n=1 Tax=Rhodococcus sp. EPR-157 TaxID=1813677 RepID=UPI0007BB2362|nr:pantoate--beta-alanine ligase [Rhodococcus sp. EPR-157]KZF04294.1 pantoate--beta-alanine ligase [Rhodococcus sp. EPR-157]